MSKPRIDANRSLVPHAAIAWRLVQQDIEIDGITSFVNNEKVYPGHWYRSPYRVKTSLLALTRSTFLAFDFIFSGNVMLELGLLHIKRIELGLDRVKLRFLAVFILGCRHSTLPFLGISREASFIEGCFQLIQLRALDHGGAKENSKRPLIGQA